LHYALDIFRLASREHKITGDTAGETLANYSVSPGDLFVGDRVYTSKNGMAHCLNGGADVLLRMRCNAFNLYAADATRLDLAQKLKAVCANRPVEIPVFVDLSRHGLGMRRMRVCAVRKSEEEIVKTLGRIGAKDSRRQEKTSEEAKKFNECFAVITSLPDNIGADQILSLYRYRWQIENWFKRFKTLLGAGEVPKKRADSMEAWLNGKMLLAVLFEILLSKLDFSPLGKSESE
jgi:hypothetical protein